MVKFIFMKKIIIIFLLAISFVAKAQEQFKNEIGIGFSTIEVYQFENNRAQWNFTLPFFGSNKNLVAGVDNSFHFGAVVKNKTCTPPLFFERHLSKQFSFAFSYQYFQSLSILTMSEDYYDAAGTDVYTAFTAFHQINLGLNYCLLQKQKFNFYAGVMLSNLIEKSHEYYTLSTDVSSGNLTDRNVSTQQNSINFGGVILLGTTIKLSRRINLKIETSESYNSLSPLIFKPIGRCSINYVF